MIPTIPASAASLLVKPDLGNPGGQSGTTQVAPAVSIRQASVEYVPVLKTEGQPSDPSSGGFLGGVFGQVIAGVAVGLILASFSK